jgi:hypothetical protein
MKLSDKPLWLRTILPFGIGIGILIYLITKSVLMQVTCDEAYTVQILAPQPVWDLITYKDSYTNNHIFNTLLIKGLFSMFGMNHSLARVPNILAFILYFAYYYLFSKRYIKEDWVSFMFMTVMMCNPYLLDFFALARGYGLAIGLMMGSIYYCARYVIDGELKYTPLSILMAILSVYAQFALLHFYLGLNLILLVHNIKSYFTYKNTKAFAAGLMYQLLGLGLLVALIYLPITAILKDNQIAYYGTKGFWQDTISSLLFHSIYAQGYFSDLTLVVFKNLTSALFTIVVLYILLKLFKKTTFNIQYPVLFVVFLFISTALSVILQFHLLGNQYVTDRTALFFYPLLAMLLPIMAVWCFELKKGLGITVSLIFIIFSLNHIKRACALDYYREWWYDRHTYEILDFLKTEYDKTDKKQTLRLNTTWTFNPSFTYHKAKNNLDWIADTTNIYDFYYCTKDEMPALLPQYEKIKDWDSGQWILMKRKLN